MSWKLVKIGDVCKTGAGGTPLKSKKEFYDGGTIPWLLSGEVSQGEIFSSRKFITEKGLQNSSAKIFPTNTVLVAMYGATAGQVGILRFEASTNQAVCGIYPNDKLLPKFIYYSMLSKQKELIGKAAGNAQPNISQIKVKNTEIPLIDLEEQKRIVAILDEAFAGIDTAIANTEKNLANARELFESYLNSVFTQENDSWPSHNLEDLTEEKSNITYGVVKPGPEGEIVFVRGGDIVSGRIRIEKLRTITKDVSEQYSRTLLRGGEILICLVGVPGQTAVVPSELSGANIARQVGLVRLKSEINPHFVSYYLRSRVGLKNLGNFTGGSVQQVINLRDLKQVCVPLPNRSKQNSVVVHLDQVFEQSRQLAEIYKQKIESLVELKQSLLQKAFSGELTAEADKLMDEAVA